MADRPPPQRTPPEFKVGDRVRCHAYGKRTFVTTVRSVEPMTDEYLVRTAYAAGFWSYEIDDYVGDGTTTVSGNLLELAVIDQLGAILSKSESPGRTER